MVPQMMPQRCDVMVKFFWQYFFSLVKFSYWSKFYVNIIACSGVMTISFIRDWPEIWKLEIPLSEFAQYLGRVRNTKFDTNVSNKMLLNAATCQGYSFYCFWVIKGKPTEGEGIKLPPPPPPGVFLLSKIELGLY